MMEIEEARKKISDLELFIETLENYDAVTFEQKVFKLYVLRENVTRITKELNEQGYRIGDRKLVTTDITKLIKSKPTNHMHEMALMKFNRNKKRSVGKY